MQIRTGQYIRNPSNNRCCRGGAEAEPLSPFPDLFLLLEFYKIQHLSLFTTHFRLGTQISVASETSSLYAQIILKSCFLLQVLHFCISESYTLIRKLDPAMEKALIYALLSCFLAALFGSSHAQICNSQTFTNNKLFSTCTDLSALNSYLHWTYNSSTKMVDLAFRHTGTSSSNWVAWALNPSGPRMAGSECLLAFQSSTGAIRAYTTLVDSTSPSLQQSNLSFQVPEISATLEGTEWTIFAQLQLTDALLSTNQVWQVGPMSGGNPGSHAMAGENLGSVGTIDFRTGETGSNAGSIRSRQRKRNVSACFCFCFFIF